MKLTALAAPVVVGVAGAAAEACAPLVRYISINCISWLVCWLKKAMGNFHLLTARATRKPSALCSAGTSSDSSRFRLVSQNSETNCCSSGGTYADQLLASSI